MRMRAIILCISLALIVASEQITIYELRREIRANEAHILTLAKQVESLAQADLETAQSVARTAQALAGVAKETAKFAQTTTGFIQAQVQLNDKMIIAAAR